MLSVVTDSSISKPTFEKPLQVYRSLKSSHFFCLVTAKILTGLPNFSLILLKPTQYCPAREATSQSPLSQLSIVVALVPTQGELPPRKGFLALLFTSCTAPYLTHLVPSRLKALTFRPDPLCTSISRPASPSLNP